MMDQISFEQTKPFSRLCKDIISLDDKIALVSIINKNGRLVESEYGSNGIIESLSPNELEMLFMQRTLQTSMIRDLDDKLGKFSIALIQRESFTEYVFSFYGGVVLVILNSHAEKDEIIKKILKLLNKTETFGTPVLTC
ncbi:MAG TPA: hypothetical protein VLF17_06675 [Candidatus Nitrosotenuis sp.]|nr:hypothetical protein [Candidatus Nitrosotenuis sp.]